jgi:putative membrane protein
MPFIDYLTLLLANMSAGLIVLALFFLRGYGTEKEKPWSAALGVVGLVAVIGGLHMALGWPITGAKWANVAYGESTVLLGAAFLGAALAVGRGWSLVPVTIYAAVAGGFAIMMGVYIAVMGLSNAPAMTAAGFILTGLAGPFSLCAVLVKSCRWPRIITAVLLLAAAALWLFTTGGSYWMHLQILSQKAA